MIRVEANLFKLDLNLFQIHVLLYGRSVHTKPVIIMPLLLLIVRGTNICMYLVVAVNDTVATLLRLAIPLGSS